MGGGETGDSNHVSDVRQRYKKGVALYVVLYLDCTIDINNAIFALSPILSPFRHLIAGDAAGKSNRRRPYRGQFENLGQQHNSSAG